MSDLAEADKRRRRIYGRPRATFHDLVNQPNILKSVLQHVDFKGLILFRASYIITFQTA
jgi:hypothetical protein